MTQTSFDPHDYAEHLESLGHDIGWEVHHLNPIAGYTRPWLRRQLGPEAPHLYLSAGIHGDEIAGPNAILEMLDIIISPDFFRGLSVTLFPLLNPVGLAKGTRGNGDGIDLNRDYRNPKTAEIAGHVEVLKTLGRFDAALCLHEDFEGIGAYLYELNETLPPALGQKIIAAMGRSVPIDLRPEIEDVPASGGILSRKDLLLKHGPIEDRAEWPEALYLTQNHTSVSYTTETPLPFTITRRVLAQVNATEALLNALRHPESI